MLCFDPLSQHSEICTNRCEKRLECKTKKIPLLIEALDVLSYEIKSDQSGPLFTTSITPYCLAPDGFINGAIYDVEN
jgi:hypothetical protein